MQIEANNFELMSKWCRDADSKPVILHIYSGSTHSKHLGILYDS